MCGRYALGVRMFFVRRRMQEQGMQVDEAPEDDEIRETYNFAPGYYGAVYRADSPDHGFDDEPPPHDQDSENISSSPAEKDGEEEKTIKYKLQKMRWGLIPFWTKRQPDYGSMMRTINCRADSLAENKGMWTSMKRKKRCVIICQGFYEWLKKGPGGKEKVPHFIKRKDGDLMYFAGLWDCVQYEDSNEKLYTYTIITTDSNPYLKFLHDRMPVILDPASKEMQAWLDPRQTTWNKELQSILKPYEGELECYPVSKEVGKVGNNSAEFLVPVNSRENKSNIANFFANAGAKKKKEEEEKGEEAAKGADKEEEKGRIRNETDPEVRETVDAEWTEDNAPKPVPRSDRDKKTSPQSGLKRKFSTDESPPVTKRQKSLSPVKERDTAVGGRKMKSATSSSPSKPKSIRNKRAAAAATTGSQRITDFFKK
ncbi:DUF159 domain protein [Talaromyces stipitatus ATCC 10500]|uniref:DUF159 domain protein n=1 Tax=Talaromyces stipitatus (strain ATCC 10500 / CBS 375.48 / QM 6759 / NRRL 1006) TaxID=441959 RepID=B8MBK2_TALSN|nr:DUF159 domain protein [Talaromyces stipitatus ATCC 10500]XP_002481859.1 DUF159 domain protein [Talaromyces stipitatus ATCC 10500]EED17866.1 DUF159 domain protein [Talaromyces stipitatus ATCC 10500]EED17867.1 DUF159 domain protein [Talaromyces stipitatus ATCC 10500]